MSLFGIVKLYLFIEGYKNFKNLKSYILLYSELQKKIYINNFQKDHFVFPATLGLFSYSSHLVLKPTNENNPFEYEYVTYEKI